MQYRNDRDGNPISLLGYGCMRFSKKGNSINLDKAEAEVMTAIRGGVNYFDTAYIYPGSEAAIGEILKRNGCREKIYLATKLPQYLIKSRGALDRYFKEQLSRLKTNYIDYYLMHMLTDVAAWEKLKKLGIEEWIDQKKSEKAIRYVGFSFHGTTEKFIEILDAYDWDFCQIQYNYMDEHTQAGRKGLEAAYKKGIPVIIMEPLRGGKLVDLLPEKAKRIIEKHPKGYTPAEWALRWLWEQKEVTCVLSGMNSISMVEENVRIASEVREGEFQPEDFDMIGQIKEEINRHVKVGCTGCGYCMPCPKGIDIPTAFRCYNHMYTEGRGTGRHEYLQVACLQKEEGNLWSCVECKKCESHCPQHLEIAKELKQARRHLLPLPYRIGLKVVRALKLFG